MSKELNSDNLSRFSPYAKVKADRQAAKIISDINRIDTIVASGNFEQLKSLHVELDGTYQNLIQNWGMSMYNYIVGMGFAYNYIDEDTLRDNLITMRGKLQGFLLEIDPNAEFQIDGLNNTRVSGGRNLNVRRKKLSSDYDKIKEISMGCSVIVIENSEYLKYKDTLDYLETFDYIYQLDLDGAEHIYAKSDVFDSFPEHLIALEVEEEIMTLDNNNSKRIFVVHGHDHQLLDDVELMLRRIGLEPVILKNEANAGRTIIEKIEELTDVGFAIVLYTGCDEGRAKNTEALQDRARQNVIFEHGYLCAKLGRNNVVAINDDGIEIPSDLSGVLYIPRSASDWKLQLMREMRAAGLKFDPTKT